VGGGASVIVGVEGSIAEMGCFEIPSIPVSYTMHSTSVRGAAVSHGHSINRTDSQKFGTIYDVFSFLLLALFLYPKPKRKRCLFLFFPPPFFPFSFAKREFGSYIKFVGMGQAGLGRFFLFFRGGVSFPCFLFDIFGEYPSGRL